MVLGVTSKKICRITLTSFFVMILLPSPWIPIVEATDLVVTGSWSLGSAVPLATVNWGTARGVRSNITVPDMSNPPSTIYITVNGWTPGSPTEGFYQHVLAIGPGQTTWRAELWSRPPGGILEIRATLWSNIPDGRKVELNLEIIGTTLYGIYRDNVGNTNSFAFPETVNSLLNQPQQSFAFESYTSSSSFFSGRSLYGYPILQYKNSSLAWGQVSGPTLVDTTHGCYAGGSRGVGSDAPVPDFWKMSGWTQRGDLLEGEQVQGYNLLGGTNVCGEQLTPRKSTLLSDSFASLDTSIWNVETGTWQITGGQGNVFTDGFEYTDSITNHRWTLLASAGTEQTQTAVVAEGARALRLDDTSGGARFSYSHSITSQTGDFEVQYYLRTTSYSMMVGFQALGNGGGINTELSDNFQKFRVQDNYYFVYNLNQWYLVKLVIRTVPKTFDVYVDGGLIASNLAFTDSAFDKLFIHTPTGGTGTGYWDGVRVTGTSTPDKLQGTNGRITSGADWWGDYKFKLEMSTTSPGDTPDKVASALFRYRDTSNTYALTIKSGLVELSKNQTGLKTVLATKTMTIDPTQVNYVAVIVQNNRIRASANSNPIFDYVDNNPILQGKVGMKAMESTAQFDNVLAYAVDNTFFADTFTSLSNWVTELGTPSINSGRLLLDLGDRVRSQSQFSNFKLTIKANTLTGGTSDDHVGTVYFRYAGTSSTYLLQLTNSGILQLRKTVSGSTTTIQSVRTNLEQSALHTITIHVAGSSIQVYANGTLFIEATDSSFTTGYVALSAQGSSTARFDDIAVESLEIIRPIEFIDTSFPIFNRWTLETIQTPSKTLSDTEINVRMRTQTVGSTTEVATILFRYADNLNTYMVRLRGDNNLELLRNNGGVLTSLSVVNIGLSPYVYHDFTIRIFRHQGAYNHIDIFVDGVRHMHIDDNTSTLLSGAVGINSPGSISYRISSLRVTGMKGMV